MASKKALFELYKSVNRSAEKNFKNIHKTTKVNYRAEAERILGGSYKDLSGTRAVHGENLSHANQVLRRGRLDNHLQDILNTASNKSEAMENVFKQEWKGPNWVQKNKPSKFSKSDQTYKGKKHKYKNEKTKIDHALNDSEGVYGGDLNDPYRRFSRFEGKARKVNMNNTSRKPKLGMGKHKYKGHFKKNTWYNKTADTLKGWGKGIADYHWNNQDGWTRFKRIGTTAGGWMVGNTVLRHMRGGDMTHNPDGESDLAGVPLI